MGDVGENVREQMNTEDEVAHSRDLRTQDSGAGGSDIQVILCYLVILRLAWAT